MHLDNRIDIDRSENDGLMKWKFMTCFLVLLVFFNSTKVISASSDDNEDEGSEPYSQLKGTVGITTWSLNNAEFLETDFGHEGYNARLSWITNFPFNKQWTFAMGFGLNSQIANLDASKRNGESFPDPFEFDQTKTVDEFNVRYHQFVMPVKLRYYLSKKSNFFVETGPEIGTLGQINYSYSKDNKTVSYDLRDESNLIQLTWDFGLGYDFKWDGDPWGVGINGFHQVTRVLSDNDLRMTPRGFNMFLRYGF